MKDQSLHRQKTAMHHHIESLLCLDLVIFLVLNRIKPQAPLLVVPFCQFLQVSGLRPCSPQNHKTLISQLDPSWFGLRPFPCVKGSYLRLDFKDPQSMPDGMGSHLPMKLQEHNSELNHSGQSQSQPWLRQARSAERVSCQLEMSSRSLRSHPDTVELTARYDGACR